MLRTGLAALAIAALPMMAGAQAIITDGDVKLGVGALGELNTTGGVADVVGETVVGVRWLDAGLEYESTSHGCLCEGWGVSTSDYGGSGPIDGGSNVADTGLTGSDITGVSFASTASTATSVVTLNGTGLKITHDFALSASDSLYEVKVTIENTGGSTATDVAYRRAMDWDTSPTPFSEFVTIGGTGTTTDLINSSDDGFLETATMLTSPIAGTDIAGCGEGVDFTGCGPSDHGAVFDFGFGDLLAGESKEFSIFYGGAADKAGANAALAAVGAELFSYGWSNLDVDQDGLGDAAGEITPTFIFAFKGVGGVVVIPDVPVPAAGWLLIGGFGLLGAMRRRKKA